MRFMEVPQPNPGQNAIVECMYMHVCVCVGGCVVLSEHICVFIYLEGG